MSAQRQSLRCFTTVPWLRFMVLIGALLVNAQSPLSNVYVDTFAGNLTTSGATDGLSRTTSSFNSPRFVAFNSVGTMFVADSGNF